MYTKWSLEEIVLRRICIFHYDRLEGIELVAAEQAGKWCH